MEELKRANASMDEALTDADMIAADHQLLQEQVEQAKQMNLAMKSQFEQHGITIISGDGLEEEAEGGEVEEQEEELQIVGVEEEEINLED